MFYSRFVFPLICYEELKPNKSSIESLKEELKVALESSENSNIRHEKEVANLTQMLRDKDEVSWSRDLLSHSAIELYISASTWFSQDSL